MHAPCTGHVAGQPETADFEPRFEAAETPSSHRRDFLKLRSLSQPTASSRVSSLVRHTEKLRSSRACCTADFFVSGRNECRSPLLALLRQLLQVLLNWRWLGLALFTSQAESESATLPTFSVFSWMGFPATSEGRDGRCGAR